MNSEPKSKFYKNQDEDDDENDEQDDIISE